jgi:hypothetical protein
MVTLKADNINENTVCLPVGLPTPPDSPVSLSLKKKVNFNGKSQKYFKANDCVACLRNAVYLSHLHSLNWNYPDSSLFFSRPNDLIINSPHCALLDLKTELRNEWDHQLFCNSFVTSTEIFEGSLLVGNLCFKKDIIVRYTMDDWGSSKDIRPVFKCSLPTKLDIFQFFIRETSSNGNPYKLEFAIRYMINGVEHWNNNNGRNFRFIVEKKILE